MARHTQRDTAAGALAADARQQSDLWQTLLLDMPDIGGRWGYRRVEYASLAVWWAKQTAVRLADKGIPEPPPKTILRAAILLLEDIREHVRERETAA